MPEFATDPLEREPKKVLALRTIDPRGDTKHMIHVRQVLVVEWFEPDRRGVGVRSDAGCYVSLHPSEFVVLEWADEPKESK